MEVAFSERGKHRFACYRLTHEESMAPDRIAKVKSNLASKGKVGYSIAITCDSSPVMPTWVASVDALFRLGTRCEMWKLTQESKLHHRVVKAQKEVKEMSISYFIFTEVQVNGQWYCINPKVMRLLPIEHLIVVPTLRSDARYQFEKAYRQLEHDGCPFTVDEMSENLQASATDWLAPEDSVRIAVYYDDIWNFVSVDEYRKMDDELKKAYQYFEWNDRSGAYRYYEEIQKKVASQVRDWKAINQRDGISSIRILLFSV